MFSSSTTTTPTPGHQQLKIAMGPAKILTNLDHPKACISSPNPICIFPAETGKQNHGFEHDDQQAANVGVLPEIVVHKCSTGSEANGRNDDDFITPSQSIGCANGSAEGSFGLTGRMKSLKLIDELMAQKGLAVASAEGTAKEKPGLFKLPHSGIQRIKRKLFSQKQSTDIFRHFEGFHRKYGFRHLVMVSLLGLYAVLGGLMFEAIERDHEIHNLHRTSECLERTISKLANEVEDILNATRVSDKQHDKIKQKIKEHYLSMLKIEDKYIGSVFHKYETLNMRKVVTWYFGSSVFYAMTLFSTIGYGTVACQTALGKVASILYAMFGIPLMLVVLSDLGQMIVQLLTVVYEKLRQSCKNSMRTFALHILDMQGVDVEWGPAPGKCSSRRESGDSESSENSAATSSSIDSANGFPLFLSAPVVLFYLSLLSLVVSNWDWGDQPGLSFGDAFYFSFLSLSTIGLGDVMPNNVQFSPLLAMLFLFGLALLSVVNSTVFLRIQNYFMALVDFVEEYLESVSCCRNDREGYFVFRSLGPNIQLLALALPIFADNQEEKISAMLEPENTPLGRRLFHVAPSRQIARSHSLFDHHPTAESFRPTLGILNTTPVMRRGTMGGHEWRRLDSLVKKSVRQERPRAVTICHFNDGKKCADIPNKVLHWENNHKIYTKKGDHQLPPTDEYFPERKSLRRVQSEQALKCCAETLSVVDELGQQPKRRDEHKSRRYVYGSPRRVRKIMDMQ